MSFCRSPRLPDSPRLICAGLVLALALVSASQGAAPDPVAGLRTYKGKHLTLVTDVPASADIDALVPIFDAAFPLWCEYLGIDPVKHADWRMTGYLIRAKERFEAAGLMNDVPPFLNGYARGGKFWFNDQTSPYYRRHLMLHEGVHSIMRGLLGGDGAPWYSEATAEFLATHRWQDGKLTLPYRPHGEREVQQLGRLGIVQRAFAENRPLSLPQIMAFDKDTRLANDPYGWCWALAMFLDSHPRYRERFRQLPRLVAEGDFGARFYKLFAADWRELNDEWQIYVANAKLNYDFPRMAIDFRPGKPLAEQGADVSVAADRGWQSTGWKLEAGRAYQLRAEGRYQVADKPRVWSCEPNGVTLRYYNSQPLGILLAAVRPDEPDEHATDENPATDDNLPADAAEGNATADKDSAVATFVRPLVVGRQATLVPKRTGTLYLRINDSAARLYDNAGAATVHAAPAARAAATGD